MKKTLENLTKAFVGESQARNRYTFYSKIAKKEGFIQVSNIFLETANQEKTHAKRLFEHIQELKENDDEIIIETSAPTVYGTTIENLQAAANGEKFEHTEMYPEFAKIAEAEGLDKIAGRLKSIAIAEEHHEARYKKLLKELENNSFFKKEEDISWVCAECGYLHIGKTPPQECPACDHPSDYYSALCEKY